MNSNTTLTEALADAYLEFNLLGLKSDPFAYMALAACEYLVEKLDESKTRQVEEYNYHDSNPFWMGRLAGMDTAARIVQREIP